MPRPARIISMLAIPAGVAAYITVSGLNGWCPVCTAIVDGVRGRTARSSVAATTPIAFTAHDLDGGSRVITSGDGRPMLIDIWGTRCPPCLEQRAVLARLAGERRDLRIVSLATDRDPRAVRQTAADHPGAGGEELLADTSTLAPLAAADEAHAPVALELPTLILVDSQGVIRSRRSGLQSLDALRSDLASLR